MTVESDKIREHAETMFHVMTDAINDWIAANPPENLAKEVTEWLNRNKKDITCHLLGFDRSWGEWRVDHCNGRAGESAVGDYLRMTASKSIKDWFDSMPLPKIEGDVAKAFEKEALEVYRREYNTQLRELVTKQAKEDAENVMRKVGEDMSTIIENHMKITALIEGKI